MKVCPECGAVSEDVARCECGHVFEPGPSQTAPRNSKLAVCSMILGIASFIVCLVVTILSFSVAGVIFVATFIFIAVFIAALTAIILGIIAKSIVLSSRGRLSGSGKAKVGIVTGVLTFILLILVAIAIPSNSFIYDQIQKKNKQGTIPLKQNYFCAGNSDDICT